jgi:hypothetical protein
MFSLLGRSEYRLFDSMNDCSGQLEHSRLLGALRAYLNRNPTVDGEGIGQDIEVFSIDPDVLRRGIPELSNARTDLRSGETALAGNHGILVSGGKRHSLVHRTIPHPFPKRHRDRGHRTSSSTTSLLTARSWPLPVMPRQTYFETHPWLIVWAIGKRGMCVVASSPRARGGGCLRESSRAGSMRSSAACGGHPRVRC